MSVAAMTWAWKQQLDPTTKFVLVALSDHANDVDFTCWPSLKHLIKKTGYSRPTIWQAVDRLVEKGLMRRCGIHASGATLYEVLVGNDVTLGKDVTQVSTLPIGKHVNGVGKDVTKVGKDVTPNHKNHHEPSITTSDKSDAIKEQKFTVEDLSVANVILADLRLLNPNHKEPNLGKWANTIRLMRERDGRTLSEILDLWQWANKHQFWSSNILSPESLRDKWDRLVIQKKQGVNQHAKPSKLQIAAEAIRQSRRNSREPIVQDVGPEPGLRAIAIGHIGGNASDD